MKRRIGDVLLDADMISKEDLEFCLGIQRKTGKKLGEIFLQENILKKEQLAAILEYQFGVKFIEVNDVKVNPRAIGEIPEALAKQHKLLPIGYDGEKLIVVMADPANIIAVDDIQLASKRELVIVMSYEDDIVRLIIQHYEGQYITQIAEVPGSMMSGSSGGTMNMGGSHDTGEYRDIGGYELDDDESEGGGGLLPTGGSTAETGPIVNAVNSIFNSAIALGASDIHIEPFERSVKIRFRIDGVLREQPSPPKSRVNEIVTRIKVIGGMDIAEKRIPQDGRYEMKTGGKEIDLRISILPTVYGEKVVMRLLDRSNINMTKEKIGFSQHNSDLFDGIIRAPEGIILLTGPTGSGKTTTLYAALQEINQPTTNIITAEDPVEYRLEGVNQVQINQKAGLTFAAVLRSILRQDPDVIMVGEMRDSETSEIAVRAAITGHLVLSTLHTNDAVSTVTRLVDMGIEPFLVSTALVGVISQRLVKRICTRCKKEIPCTEEDMHLLGIDKPIKLYKGTGCRECNNSGYKGRVAVHEILVMNKDLKNLVNKGADVSDLRAAAEAGGMRSLAVTCRESIFQGTTTIDEMLRVAYSVDD